MSIPNFEGELLFDSAGLALYVSEGTTSSDWVKMVVPARTLQPLMSSPGENLDLGPTLTNSIWPGVSAVTPTGTSLTVDGFVAGDPGRTGNARYWQAFRYISDEATGDPIPSPTIDWYLRIPDEFTGWDGGGIRVLHKVVWFAGADDEPADVTLEAMDPATDAAWGTPKKATRSIVAGTDDTSAQWIQLDSSDLGSDYAAGDMLHLQLILAKSSFNGGTPNTIYIDVGAIQVHWTDA